MDKDKLIKLLRDPQKYRRKQRLKRQMARLPIRPSRSAPWVFMGVLFLVAVSLLFIFAAQRKAENIHEFIDKNVLKGLMVERTFSPQPRKRYIQISEGAERSVRLTGSGDMLPVISRYNFQTFPKSSYEIIGTAPWALSVNILANEQDPELLHYLFNQDAMIQAYLKREDVSAVLNDVSALGRLAGDENALHAFFTEEAMQKMLASEELVNAFADSRFCAFLLTSPAVKYYREHPTAAAQLIRSNRVLSALKKNENVRKAVSENVYLKQIAPTLLQ